MLKAWLAHPLTRGLEIDDPRTTHLREQIIQEKRFLRRIYQEWYEAISTVLPSGEGSVLELGAGAGFMKDFIPGLITSEIFSCPNIRAVLDASRLPFVARSLRGIVMTDVSIISRGRAAVFCRGHALHPAWRSDRDGRALGHPLVKVCLHAITSRAVSARDALVGITKHRSAFRRQRSIAVDHLC